MPKVLNPLTWPLFWRRAFIFALPVSGSIWLVAVAFYSAWFFVKLIGGFLALAIMLMIAPPEKNTDHPLQ